MLKQYLEGKDWKNVVKREPSSTLVYSGTLNGKDYIFKTDERNSTQGKFLVDLEREILEKTKGLEGISMLKEVINLDSEIKNNPFLPYALQKEFVHGRRLVKGERITAVAEKQMYETIESIHDLGYCALDLNLRNYIISPKKEIILIDPVHLRTIRKSEVTETEWEQEKMDDILEVEYILNKIRF